MVGYSNHEMRNLSKEEIMDETQVFFTWVIVSIVGLVFISTMVKNKVLKLMSFLLCLVPPLSLIIVPLLALLYLASGDIRYDIFNRTESNSKKTEQEKSNSILEKASREYGMYNNSPVSSFASKIIKSKKSSYYSASLIGAIELMFIDFIKDSYDIVFSQYFDNSIDKFEVKKHITKQALESVIKELTQLLDIQLAWLKEMEDKDNQLDNIAYMERNNKRLEIIKSMSDDVNKLYGKDAKEVLR